MQRSLVGCLVALGCLVAGLLSCDDDGGSRPCDGSRIGVVCGYVRVAGEAPRTRTVLGLYDANRHSGISIDVETRADSTGRYEFHVPYRDYVLHGFMPTRWNYTRAGLVGGYGSPDTLTLSSDSLRVDIHLGAVTVDLAVPASLDSPQVVGVRFVPVDPDLRPDVYEGMAPDGGHARADAISLVPGTYRVGLEIADERFWLPGTVDPDLATTLEVGPDAPVRCEGVIGEPWYLSGEVLGAWRTFGLDPPDVHVVAPDSTHLVDIDAAADGTYRLAVFPRTPVRLLIAANHGASWRWVGGVDFADAQEFIGAPGETIVVPTVLGSGLECRIEPPSLMLPAFARVTLIDADGKSAIPSDFESPNVNPLIFPCLEPGTYFLKLAPRYEELDWCPQWFGQTDDFEEAVPIVIPPAGGIARIDMVLSSCGTVTGRVLRPDGSPAGGRRVELFPADDPSQGTESSPDFAVTEGNTGDFVLRHLNNGEYRIGVRRTFTTLVWYPGTLSWDEAEVIDLEDFGQISGLEWSLIE